MTADIDPPGSVFTFTGQGTALNLEGIAVGLFADSAGVYHGFLHNPSGQTTIIDVPGAGVGPSQGTFLLSIDDFAVSTGYFIASDNTQHGFIRYSNGQYAKFDAPSGVAAQNEPATEPQGVNLLSAATGQTFDRNGTAHGFIRGPLGRMTSFDAPGAGVTDGAGTFPLQVNLEGTVTGSWMDAAGLNHGFVRP